MMPDVDPSKVVAVFENLLGPKLGRFVITSLLVVAVLFSFFWLSKGIWTNGGKEIFEGIPSMVPLEDTNLANVQTTASTFLIFLNLYGIAFAAILYFLGRRLFRKNVSQAALDKLAELRNKGIDTAYAVSVKNGSELTDWIKKKEEWMNEIRRHVKNNFPQADYLFVSHLGVVGIRNVDLAFNDIHRRELCFVVRQLEIVEQILNSYRK